MAIQRVTDDFVTVQTAGDTYLGNDTAQIYSINSFQTKPGDTIIISDKTGDQNTIELRGGLEIQESFVTADNKLVLVLSNGAQVFIDGYLTFQFNTGGDDSSGETGVVQTATEFVEDTLHSSIPAEGEDPAQGGAVEIPTDGTLPPPPDLVFTLEASDETAVEGEDVTFTVTAAVAVEEDTVVTFTPAVGDAAAADTGTATTNANDFAAAFAPVEVTILAGETSAEFVVSGKLDALSELTESYSVTATITGETVVDGTATVDLIDPSLTFELTSDASDNEIIEGLAATYTVTASETVAEDTVVEFKVHEGDSGADDQGSSDTNLNDFTAGTFNPIRVTIEAGDRTASFSVTGKNDGLTELPEAYSVTAAIEGEEGEFRIETSLLDGAGTFILETGIDNVEGTLFDDTIEGTLDAVRTTRRGFTNVSTFSDLDKIDGDEGTDTFNLNILNDRFPQPASATVESVEILNVQSVAGLTIDTTNWTGLEYYNIIGALGDVEADAATTTAISVTNANAEIDVMGGSSTTIDVKGNDDITVDGSGDVTINTTESDDDDGDIVLGDTAANTGAIVVNNSGAAYTAATADYDTGSVTSTGGTTVNITQVATSDNSAAATDTSAATITQGDVTVTGGDATTDVTVNQDAAVAAVDAIPAVDAVFGTQVVTFVAMVETETVTIDGLVFTAAAGKALTAAEVAAAFSDLSANDLQSAGGPVENGVFTVESSANFTTGSVSGNTITYTEVVAGTNGVLGVADTVVVGDVSKAPGVTGVTAVTGVTGELGIENGIVTINDNATASITTVAVDGYAEGATLGGGGSLDALTMLSLANSVGGDAALTSTSTVLDLIVNNVNADGANDANVDMQTSAVTALNITTTGSDSDLALDANTVTALTISGTQHITLNNTNLNALQTAVVSGSAGVELNVSGINTVTDFDASATSGNNTVRINPASATYKGGSGVDMLTFGTNNAPSKAVTLGAGDDTLELHIDTSAIAAGGTISGGADIDTLSMSAAGAVLASGTTAFASVVTDFEHLTLREATGVQAVDVAKLGPYNYVTVAGIADGAGDDVLTIDNLASGGTVAITGGIEDAGAIDDDLIINVTDAATGTSDVVNLIISNNSGIGVEGVHISDVETINVTSTDENAPNNPADPHHLMIKGGAVTTMTVDGNADLDLMNEGMEALTLLDAHTMTGGLIAGTNGVVAQTILGGSGGDFLWANGTNDVLMGNDGDDTLMSGNLTQLTGGAGNDTFDMTALTTNVNSYGTILDIESGDVIRAMPGAFIEAEIVLAPTAQFQDFANAAANSSTVNDDILWFQFGDNTFIIQDANTGGAAYDEATDTIISISGLVDLTTDASYNATAGTIEMI